MGQRIDFGGPLGIVEFPDDFTDEQIVEAVNSDEFIKGAEALGYDISKLRPPEPELKDKTSFFGDMGTAGFKAKQALDLTPEVIQLTLTDAGEETKREAVASIVQQLNQAETRSFSKSLEEDFQEIFDTLPENANFIDEVLHIFKNIPTKPRAALALLAQSYVTTAPGIVGASAGAALTQTGVAAPAGLPLAVASMGISSGAADYANSIIDSAVEAGYNVYDDDALYNFFENEEVLNAARSKAAKKGMSTGIFDGLSVLIGGRLFGPSLNIAASSLKRADKVKAAMRAASRNALLGGATPDEVARIATQAGRSAAGKLPKLAGGAVEVLSQGALGGAGAGIGGALTGELSGLEVGSEFILEAIGGAPEIALGTLARGRRPESEVLDDLIADLQNTTDPTPENPDGTATINREDPAVGMGVTLSDGATGTVRGRYGNNYMVIKDDSGEAALVEVGGVQLYQRSNINYAGMNPEEIARARDKASMEAITGLDDIEQQLTPGNIARIIGVSDEELSEQVPFNYGDIGYEGLREAVLTQMSLTPEQEEAINALRAPATVTERSPNILANWDYLKDYMTPTNVPLGMTNNVNNLISAFNVPNESGFTRNELINEDPQTLIDRLTETNRRTRELRDKEIRRLRTNRERGNTTKIAEIQDNIAFLDEKVAIQNELLGRSKSSTTKPHGGVVQTNRAKVPEKYRKNPTKDLDRLHQGQLAAFGIELGVPAGDIFNADGTPKTKEVLIQRIKERVEQTQPAHFNEVIKPDPRRQPLEQRPTRRTQEQIALDKVAHERARTLESAPTTTEPVAPSPEMVGETDFSNLPIEDQFSEYEAEEEYDADPAYEEVSDDAPMREAIERARVKLTEETITTPPLNNATMTLEDGRVPFSSNRWEVLEDAGFDAKSGEYADLSNNGIPQEYLDQANAGKVYINGQWKQPTQQMFNRIRDQLSEITRINERMAVEWETSGKKPKGYVKKSDKLFKMLGHDKARMQWRTYFVLMTNAKQDLAKQLRGMHKQLIRSGITPPDTEAAQERGGDVERISVPKPKEVIRTEFKGTPEEIRQLKERGVTLEAMLVEPLRKLNRHGDLLTELTTLIGMYDPLKPAPVYFVQKVRAKLPNLSGVPASTSLRQWQDHIRTSRDLVRRNQVDPIMQVYEGVNEDIQERTTPTVVERSGIEELAEQLAAERGVRLMRPANNVDQQALLEFNNLADLYSMSPRDIDFLAESPLWISSEGKLFNTPSRPNGRPAEMHSEVARHLPGLFTTETDFTDVPDLFANWIAERANAVRFRFEYYEDGTPGGISIAVPANGLSPAHMQTIMRVIGESRRFSGMQLPDIWIDVVQDGNPINSFNYQNEHEARQWFNQAIALRPMQIPTDRPSGFLPVITYNGVPYISYDGTFAGAEARLLDDNQYVTPEDLAKHGIRDFVDPVTGVWYSPSVAAQVARVHDMLKPGALPSGRFAGDFNLTPEMLKINYLLPWEYNSPFTDPSMEFTSQFKRHKEHVMDMAQDLARRIGLNIPMHISDSKNSAYYKVLGEKYAIEGTPAYYFNNMIHVAVDTLYNGMFVPSNVVGHELMHYLKAVGVISPQEWHALETAAEKGNWIDRYEIHNRYPDDSYEMQLEEAIASEFGAYLQPLFNPEMSGWQPVEVSIFGKIKKFIRAVASALGYFGFHKPTDIFQDIYSGAYAKRRVHFDNRAENLSPITAPKWIKAKKDMDKAAADLGKISDYKDFTQIRSTISTPKELAHWDKSQLFTKFWWTARQMKQYFNSVVSESVTMLAPYGRAVKDPAKRHTLRKAMEIAQMASLDSDAQVIPRMDENGNLQGLTFVNSGEQGRGVNSRLKPNEVITLEGEMLEAYQGVQAALRHAMSSVIDSQLYGNIGQLKKWWADIDPQGLNDSYHVSDLINDENPGDIQHILTQLGINHILVNGERVEVDPANAAESLNEVPDNMRPVVGWLTLLNHIEGIYERQAVAVEEEYKKVIERSNSPNTSPQEKAALTDRQRQLENEMDKLISAWDSGLSLQQSNLESYEQFMRNEHYMPLMRFGQYYILFRDPKTNEVLHYSQVEINPYKKEFRNNAHVTAKIKQAIGSIVAANPELADAEVEYKANTLDRLRQDLNTNKALEFIKNTARVGNIEFVAENLTVSSTKSDRSDYKVANQIIEDMSFEEASQALQQARDSARAGAQALRESALIRLLDSSTFKTRSAGFAKQLWQPRRNIPGYSVDFERAIASYITGAARHAAKLRYKPYLDQQLIDIDTASLPVMKQYADKYYDYVMNPVEEMRWLRSLGFMWWLGANLSSAALQTMSAIQFTGPMLSSIAGMGPARATGAMTKAFKDTNKMLVSGVYKGAKGDETFRDMWVDFAYENMPKDFKEPKWFEDITRALNEGILKNFAVLEEQGLSPHARRLEIVAGERSGGKLSRGVQWLTTVAALPFNSFETYTRTVTYMAAHRAARDPKLRAKIIKNLKEDNLFKTMVGDKPIEQFTPHEFASFMVESNLGVFGKDNRARFMRGPLGAPLFQFQTYPLMMLELLKRMMFQYGNAGKRGFAMMMLAAVLTGGLYGLPGAEDLEEFYGAAHTEITGQDPMIRDTFRDMLYDLGNEFFKSPIDDGSGMSGFLADLLEFGVPGAAGFDIQRRVNLQIPGADILKAALGVQGDVDDLLGMPGSTWLGNSKSFWQVYKQGRTLDALPYALPASIRNAIQGWDWQRSGVKTLRGNQIITPEEYNEINMLQQVGKYVGFTPMEVRKQRDLAHTLTRLNTAVRGKQDRITSRMASLYERMLASENQRDRVKARGELLELIQEVVDHNNQVFDSQQEITYLLSLPDMLKSARERAVKAREPKARLRDVRRVARPEALEKIERYK